MTLSTSEPMIVARRTAMMLLDFQPAILAHVLDRDALIDRAQIALGLRHAVWRSAPTTMPLCR